MPANAGCVLLVNCTGILAENLLAGEHNGFGVALWYTTNSTVRNVTASNNMFGINLMMSDGNNILNNTMTDNVNGLYLSNSGNNTLRNNVMETNLANFGVVTMGPTIDPADWINDIDGSNTVDGKPVCYWVNQSDRIVPRDAGVLYLASCSNITVKDMSSSDNLFGVCLFGTNDCVLENITVQRCVMSFLLFASSNNVLKTSAALDGIWSADGVLILMGNNNTIVGNTISNMKTPANPRPQQEGPPPEGVGLSVMGNDNRIFHNNFVNNTHHTFTTQSQSNIWDDGYPSGGNYFDDYNGTDVFKSVYQNVTGSDGIGDAPYVIDSGNRDNYPLMKPYPWALHDLGVTSVSNSKTFVGQGSNMSLSVMLFNYGNSSETSNVQIYANSTLISSQVVVIAGGDSAIVSFLWNPEGLTKGNYTISAYVDPVSGEIVLVDNNVTGRWVLVTLLGDITGPDGWPDGKVDMRDVGLVARHFGEAVRSADPNWDVWQDWKIDMRDISLAARHFGEAY